MNIQRGCLEETSQGEEVLDLYLLIDAGVSLTLNFDKRVVHVFVDHEHL